MAGGRAIAAIVEGKDSTVHQRFSAHGCGLEGFQITAAVASRFVEVDLSFNDVSTVDSLGPSFLRSLVVVGNRLVKPPCFRVEMPKLVKLNLSFNNIEAVPPPEALAMLPNLRMLGMQNCMIRTLSGAGGACALASLQNLASLDLSYNLLSSVADMQGLTCLQRLQELDVGCNELCAQEGYDEGASPRMLHVPGLLVAHCLDSV